MDERARKAAYRARQQEKGLASTTVWVPTGSQEAIHLMAGSLQTGLPFSWVPAHPNTIIPLQARLVIPTETEDASLPPEDTKAEIGRTWMIYALLGLLALVTFAAAAGVTHLVKTGV